MLRTVLVFASVLTVGTLGGGESAGVGAAFRSCHTERNDPHEKQACAELKVHVAARRDKATLAEDRDRFDCLLQREDRTEVRKPPREATVTAPSSDADRARKQHIRDRQNRTEVTADVNERASDVRIECCSVQGETRVEPRKHHAGRHEHRDADQHDIPTQTGEK